MKQKKILKIVLAGCFIAIGWVLPFLTGQIKQIGNMLCPMHLPVYLAAFMLGPGYGLLVGLIIPTSRSLIFGMPYLFPNAVCMSIELGAYGFISGFLFNVIFKNLRKNKKELLISTLISLIIAMIGGRIIWGLARMACLLAPKTEFTAKMFISGAFLTAWPGIILQLVLIPILVLSLSKLFIINPEIDTLEEGEKNE